MTRDELRRLVLMQLSSIAPESDPASIDPSADLREQLDLDSMDFLRFVTALHETLRVDIPERDYAAIRTVDGAVAYLERCAPRSRE